MRGSVVFDTIYGNTKLVAEAIAEEIRAEGHQAEMVDLRIGQKAPSQADFMFIGSPTRYMRMTGRTKKFINGLDKGAWGTKPIAPFECYGPVKLESLEESKADQKWIATGAAQKIADLAREKGLTVHSPSLRMAVVGIRGPLAPNQVEEAKKYTQDFLATMKK